MAIEHGSDRREIIIALLEIQRRIINCMQIVAKIPLEQDKYLHSRHDVILLERQTIRSK